MKQLRSFAPFVLGALAVGASACTMNNSEPPAFSGPSEFGTSITVAITPDVIQQDGASQSVVTVTARGPNSEPLANVPLRAEIRVNGTPTDFGSLSARNIVTDANGRATLIYTAPPGVGGLAVDDFTVVDIAVTPIGNNFANSTARQASLRLVPRGTVVPPAGLNARFTFSPSSPTDNQAVLFDASTSQANLGIEQYTWNFGDGSRAQTTSSPTIAHTFTAAGTYVVSLTIEDGLGRTATTSQSVTVGAGANPTASFTISPTDPRRLNTVNFNGIASSAAPGRRIVGYLWDFGDGKSASGVQAQNVYTFAGTYTVSLTVTDDAGRTATVSQTLTVNP